MELEELKYPIGRLTLDHAPSADKLEQWIANIEQFPIRLGSALNNATLESLSWPYRPGGRR